MRYFFHIFDGAGTIEDEEGADLSDREAAVRQAAIIAGELSQEGDVNRGCVVRIVDEHGNEIGGMPVIAATKGNA